MVATAHALSEPTPTKTEDKVINEEELQTYLNNDWAVPFALQHQACGSQTDDVHQRIRSAGGRERLDTTCGLAMTRPLG